MRLKKKKMQAPGGEGGGGLGAAEWAARRLCAGPARPAIVLRGARLQPAARPAAAPRSCGRTKPPGGCTGRPGPRRAGPGASPPRGRELGRAAIAPSAALDAAQRRRLHHPGCGRGRACVCGVGGHGGWGGGRGGGPRQAPRGAEGAVLRWGLAGNTEWSSAWDRWLQMGTATFSLPIALPRRPPRLSAGPLLHPPDPVDLLRGGGAPRAPGPCPTLLRPRRPPLSSPQAGRASPPAPRALAHGNARPAPRPPLGVGGSVGIPGGGSRPLSQALPRGLRTPREPLGGWGRGGDVIQGAGLSEPG
jgi:hypothetical protein